MSLNIKTNDCCIKRQPFVLLLYILCSDKGTEIQSKHPKQPQRIQCHNKSAYLVNSEKVDSTDHAQCQHYQNIQHRKEHHLGTKEHRIPYKTEHRHQHPEHSATVFRDTATKVRVSHNRSHCRTYYEVPNEPKHRHQPHGRNNSVQMQKIDAPIGTSAYPSDQNRCKGGHRTADQRLGKTYSVQFFPARRKKSYLFQKQSPDKYYDCSHLFIPYQKFYPPSRTSSSSLSSIKLRCRWTLQYLLYLPRPESVSSYPLSYFFDGSYI